MSLLPPTPPVKPTPTAYAFTAKQNTSSPPWKLLEMHAQSNVLPSWSRLMGMPFEAETSWKGTQALSRLRCQARSHPIKHSSPFAFPLLYQYGRRGPPPCHSLETSRLGNVMYRGLPTSTYINEHSALRRYKYHRRSPFPTMHHFHSPAASPTALPARAPMVISAAAMTCTATSELNQTMGRRSRNEARGIEELHASGTRPLRESHQYQSRANSTRRWLPRRMAECAPVVHGLCLSGCLVMGNRCHPKEHPLSPRNSSLEPASLNIGPGQETLLTCWRERYRTRWKARRHVASGVRRGMTASTRRMAAKHAEDGW